MRDFGAWGIGWILLVFCFAIALTPIEPVAPVTSTVPVELPQEESVPVVAITFDDGPRKSTTTKLLDALALREVPATFFLVGSRISGQEELIQRMHQEGHQIGIHTYDHVILRDLSQDEFQAQIQKSRDLLKSIVPDEEFWLRPPYGILDRQMAEWANSPIILWSVDPEDWKDDNVSRIVQTILEEVEDGDIILMHDLYASSVDAAIQVVDALLEQGYCFLTVEELLEYRGITPENGVRYCEA